jgi:hypothetical protein
LLASNVEGGGEPEEGKEIIIAVAALISDYLDWRGSSYCVLNECCVILNEVMAWLLNEVMAWPFVFQVYFPVFIGSSIYLRFLNELVHMLNREEDAPSSEKGNATMVTDRVSKEVDLSHVIMWKDLDDPDSLWERPNFL